jgi:hypothetical protein
MALHLILIPRQQNPGDVTVQLQCQAAPGWSKGCGGFLDQISNLPPAATSKLSFLFVSVLWDWGLNLGLRTYKASAVLTEPHF